MLLMSSLIFIFLVVLVPHVVLARGIRRSEEILVFDQNYKVTWGDNHVMSLNQGKEIQLTMDNSSGYNKSFHFPQLLINLLLNIPCISLVSPSHIQVYLFFEFNLHTIQCRYNFFFLHIRQIITNYINNYDKN